MAINLERKDFLLIMEEKNSKRYRRSRVLVIIEAAVEYFIALCATSTCLTAVLNEMQVSTSLQGVITAITSLACSVQLLAVFSVKKTYPCKRWVSILNLINQLLFAVMYFIPMFSVSKEIKVVFLIATLLAAYSCQHYLTPSRVSWQMSLVDDNKRGIFTANKEIVSLLGGMAVSQVSGILLDHFTAKGDMQTCFIIFAVTIVVLSLIHLYIMLATHEPKPETPAAPKSFREILGVVFGSRNLRRVVIFDALFTISSVSLNFYSVYLVNTLGLSFTYIAAINILHCLFRALVSRFLGALADKKSWAYMLRICMLVLSAGYAIFLFCTPENAVWMYPIFSLCYAFSLGGSNAGRNNLCLDYVAVENRRYVLGIQHAISGVLGFLATLVASVLVDYVEQNGNALLGISVYPQQILFAISCVMVLALAFGFLPFLSKPRRVSTLENQQ